MTYALDKPEQKDEAKPRPKQSPAEREGDIIQAVLATESGREFVWMIMKRYSLNKTPLRPAEHLDLHDAMVYHAAQQDVVRWLMNLCGTHAPAGFRAMSVESYIRREQET